LSSAGAARPGAGSHDQIHASDLDDPALAAIGEIVHDIDLKDGKFGREEASGIARVMDGIAASKDDERRLERGAAVLDGLYEVFRAMRRQAARFTA
jgi:hypothetical protein